MLIEKLLLKFCQRYALSEEERSALSAAMDRERTFHAGEIIVREEEPLGFSSLLLDGFACRSKYLADGRRQIMEISIAGDFVDLHSYPLQQLDHSVTAISACRMLTVPHQNITKLVHSYPRLARILWFSTMVDASIHREWLLSLGSRTALQRIAHLFCECYYRLRVVELVDGLSFPLPLTQGDLAEAVGLTNVHVNRTLRHLRERDLAAFRSRTVQIRDLPALKDLAGFDPAYLYLEPRSY